MHKNCRAVTILLTQLGYLEMGTNFLGLWLSRDGWGGILSAFLFTDLLRSLLPLEDKQELNAMADDIYKRF